MMEEFGSLRLTVPKRSPPTNAQPFWMSKSRTRFTVGMARLNTGEAGVLTSYSNSLSDVPKTSGNAAMARLFPSSLMVRARQSVSPLGLAIGVNVTAVPNGTLPRETGPETRLEESVAVSVIASPEAAARDVVKLPSVAGEKPSLYTL